MKWFLILLVLSSLMSCQKKDVGAGLPTSDALYRTWRLTQISYDGQATSPDEYTPMVTFPRDGHFRGTQPNDTRWCCTPVAFEGTNTAIRFIWDTSNSSCALINCRLSALSGDVTWQIITLTNERLVLVGGKQTLAFEPVP